MEYDTREIASYLFRLSALLESEHLRMEAFKYNEDVSDKNLWRESEKVKDMANDFYNGEAVISKE